MAGGRPKHPDILTPAEWRVLDGVRAGKTNGEIADDLGLSVNTVKYHVSNILGKLELTTREELAAWNRPRSWRWLLAPRVALVASTTAIAVGVGVVIVLALLGGGTDAETPDSEPAGRIAFVVQNTTGPGTMIWYLPANQSCANPPCSTPGFLSQRLYDTQFWPTWSPDGAQVAYLGLPAGANVQPGQSSVADLYVVSPDLGQRAADQVSILPAEGVIPKPAWRSHGGLLLFTTQDFIASVAAPDGSQRQDESLGCESSSWARDGAIALCSAFDADATSPGVHTSLDIWPALDTGFRAAETRIPTRNNNPTYATTSVHLAGIQVQPVMSDDGAWLAWWGYTTGNPPHVYAAPVQPDRQIVKDRMLDLGPGEVPEFAPGSHRLVFSTSTDMSFPPVLAKGDVVVYDLDSNKTTNVTHGGSNRWPTWSPDGQFIALVSDRDESHGEVYTVRADGSQWWRLTNNNVAEWMPDWSPR